MSAITSFATVSHAEIDMPEGPLCAMKRHKKIQEADPGLIM
jgi:hypothetical protein